MPLIVPAYAALLCLLFVGLSARVALTRRRLNINIGTGGNAHLERIARVQGNFAEYVPFALIIFTFVELQVWPDWAVHTLCALLLIGRVVHAIGVSREPENILWRGAGMLFTHGPMIVASVLLIIGGIWHGPA